MKPPLRILLIDDHLLFRESLVRLLEHEDDFKVVAHYSTIREALKILQRSPVDILLLDYDLGEEFGTDRLPELFQSRGAVRIIIVTAGMQNNIMLKALNSGISGIVLKHTGPQQLIEAIHRVAKGDLWLDSRLIRSLVEGVENTNTDTAAPTLTDRQRQVLRSILDGRSNKETAASLKVSETSVKATIQELFNKSGTKTRSQLVRIAIEKYSDSWLNEKP